MMTWPHNYGGFWVMTKKAIKLAPSEKETHLSMTADDRSVWHIYSDDEVMQRKLEAAGAMVVLDDGLGKHYELPASRVTFRKPRKPLTEEQKAQMGVSLAKAREILDKSRRLGAN